jgi:hypothetical protein
LAVFVRPIDRDVSAFKDPAVWAISGVPPQREADGADFYVFWFFFGLHGCLPPWFLHQGVASLFELSRFHFSPLKKGERNESGIV